MENTILRDRLAQIHMEAQAPYAIGLGEGGARKRRRGRPRGSGYGYLGGDLLDVVPVVGKARNAIQDFQHHNLAHGFADIGEAALEALPFIGLGGEGGARKRRVGRPRKGGEGGEDGGRFPKGKHLSEHDKILLYKARCEGKRYRMGELKRKPKHISLKSKVTPSERKLYKTHGCRSGGYGYLGGYEDLGGDDGGRFEKGYSLDEKILLWDRKRKAAKARRLGKVYHSIPITKKNGELKKVSEALRLRYMKAHGEI